MGFFRSFEGPHGRLALVIEDDDRVGYAYLVRDEAIVSHVWLYNRGPAPTSPPWAHAPPDPPYLNPHKYIVSRPVVIEDPDDVEVQWDPNESVATISLGGMVLAILGADDKPGYCANAAANGPLAQPLSSHRDPR